MGKRIKHYEAGGRFYITNQQAIKHFIGHYFSKGESRLILQNYINDIYMIDKNRGIIHIEASVPFDLSGWKEGKSDF